MRVAARHGDDDDAAGLYQHGAAARELAGVAQMFEHIAAQQRRIAPVPGQKSEVAVPQQVGANVDTVPRAMPLVIPRAIPWARVEMNDFDPARRERSKQITFYPGLHILAKRPRAAADIEQRRYPSHRIGG